MITNETITKQQAVVDELQLKAKHNINNNDFNRGLKFQTNLLATMKSQQLREIRS